MQPARERQSQKCSFFAQYLNHQTEPKIGDSFTFSVRKQAFSSCILAYASFCLTKSVLLSWPSFSAAALVNTALSRRSTQAVFKRQPPSNTSSAAHYSKSDRVSSNTISYPLTCIDCVPVYCATHTLIKPPTRPPLSRLKLKKRSNLPKNVKFPTHVARGRSRSAVCTYLHKIQWSFKHSQNPSAGRPTQMCWSMHPMPMRITIRTIGTLHFRCCFLLSEFHGVWEMSVIGALPLPFHPLIAQHFASIWARIFGNLQYDPTPPGTHSTPLQPENGFFLFSSFQ